MTTLFRWIHLSDIHVGHGDKSHGWDQELVMDVLRQDIAAEVKKRAQPIDAILVTGDIAFSGAGRSADEYTRAKAWLGGVAVAAGVAPAQIYVVPGNHDVNRGVDKERSVKRLIDGLREGTDKLDTALADKGDRAILARRMAAYLAFAADFAPVEFADERLFWRAFVAAREGLKVRLVGLNTALLAADDQDQSKLWLGKEQLTRTLLSPPIEEGELVMVLTHHPLVDGWLADQKEIDAWVRGKAHVHLSGHVHEADSEAARKGWGDVFVRIVAGSVHGEQLPPGIPAGHGYSFGELVRGDDGKARVQIWPRKWSAKQTRFVRDVENVPEGQDYAEHEIKLKLAAGAVAPPGAPKAPPPSPGPTAPSAGRKTYPVAPGSNAPVEVFISSCPSDRDLSAELEKHLVPLKRQGMIRVTSARSIGYGEDARAKIEEGFEGAILILLLLSADYLAWDYCDDDLVMAQRRYAEGGATVIPIVMKPVELEDPRSKEAGKEWFAGLVRLPRDAPPVTKWADKDEALASIASEIKKLVALPGRGAK